MRFLQNVFFQCIIAGILSSNVFAQVNASFTIDRYNICSGTTVQLLNTSTGADAYEWIIEGIHYSYSRDTFALLNESCYDVKSIKLIARSTSSGLSDSASTVVEVFDSCYFHLTGDYLLCPGDTVKLGVNTEEISTQFLINPPQTLLGGCLTCSSIEFILSATGVSVDRTSEFFGGCKKVTTYHYTGTIATCGFTDIGEVDQQLIEISPNPVIDHLNIQADIDQNIDLMIFNSLGQNVIHTYAFKNDINIDFSEFPSGLYFIRLKFENSSTLLKKVVKTK